MLPPLQTNTVAASLFMLDRKIPRISYRRKVGFDSMFPVCRDYVTLTIIEELTSSP